VGSAKKALDSRESQMKYLKMMGLLAVAAVALMAYVGTASALITHPIGTHYNGQLRATSTHVVTHGSVSTTCKHSFMEVTVTNGFTNTHLNALTFGSCEPDKKSVLTKGSLRFFRSGGQVFFRSTGLESTVQLHRTIFGFPVTTHCIYKTNETLMGTVTEEASPPVIHFESAAIPQVATDGACGESSIWTGKYTITSPIPIKFD
jgi:hypothetical protein